MLNIDTCIFKENTMHVLLNPLQKIDSVESILVSKERMSHLLYKPLIFKRKTWALYLYIIYIHKKKNRLHNWIREIMAALLKNVDLQISKDWKHFNGLVMRF